MQKVLHPRSSSTPHTHPHPYTHTHTHTHTHTTTQTHIHSFSISFMMSTFFLSLTHSFSLSANGTFGHTFTITVLNVLKGAYMSATPTGELLRCVSVCMCMMHTDVRMCVCCVCMRVGAWYQTDTHSFVSNATTAVVGGLEEFYIGSIDTPFCYPTCVSGTCVRAAGGSTWCQCHEGNVRYNTHIYIQIIHHSPASLTLFEMIWDF